MTSRRVHAASIVPAGILATVLGYHPLYWVALVIGVLLPEVDAIRERFHRSWVFHTFLPTAVAYQFVVLSGLGDRYPFLVTGVHFVTVGLLFHFLFDFVYPKHQTHDGAEWSVRPTIFSDHWGLMWLGLSWFVQWFIYLAGAFIPWTVGAVS